ncbi:MAG: cytochrome P450, partial [Pseudomonadota bacterium]
MRKRAGGPVAGLAWWMPKTVRVLAHNMLALDDPDHRRLRGLVDGVFARRAVLAMEGQIETHAKGLLQRAVADRGASKRDRTIDLMSAYARPLPMMVICDLLGVPTNKREPFMKDALHLSGIAGVVGFLRALWPLRRLRLRVERLIADASVRLKAGGKPTGLIDDLVVLQRDGYALWQDELVAMVFLLLLAGHETTTHAIAGSVMASAVS